MAASKSHSGPHKHHGPKRHMFHDVGNKSIRFNMTHIEYEVPNKSGALGPDGKPLTHTVRFSAFSKYVNKDAWIQACMAHGQKKIPNVNRLWSEYFNLPDNKAKRTWLSNLKNRDLWKEEEAYRKAERTKQSLKPFVKGGNR